MMVTEQDINFNSVVTKTQPNFKDSIVIGKKRSGTKSIDFSVPRRSTAKDISVLQ